MDITDSVLSVNTDIGLRKESDYISFDGKLNIVINLDKLDVATLFKQGLLVRVEMQDSRTGEWKPLYTGYTDKVKYSLGVKVKRATIECFQGIGELKNTVIEPITDNTITIDTAIEHLLNSNRVKKPFNLDNYNGENIFQHVRVASLHGNTVVLDGINNNRGINTFNYIGARWTLTTKMYVAIQQLLEAEAAKLWINRNGQYEFRNYRRFFNFNYIFKEINTSKIVKNVYDTRINAFNEVVVNWFSTRPSESRRSSIWDLDYQYGIESKSTSEAIKMSLALAINRYFGVSDGLFTDEIDFKVFNLHYNNNPEIIAPLYSQFLIELDDFEDREAEDMLMDGEEKPEFNPFILDEGTDVDNVEFIVVQHNNEHYIAFYNDYNIPIWITVTNVQGRLLDTSETTTTHRHPIRSIENLKEYSNPIIDEERKTKILADYIFLRSRDINNRFASITLVANTDEEMNEILDITLGSYIKIDNDYFIVIAEKISSSKVVVNATYRLFQLPDTIHFSASNNRLPQVLGL